MRRWFINWLETYGEILGFVLFCVVFAALAEGCVMLVG